VEEIWRYGFIGSDSSWVVWWIRVKLLSSLHDSGGIKQSFRGNWIELFCSHCFECGLDRKTWD